MSWSEAKKILGALAVTAALLTSSACTVQPLHGGGEAGPVSSQLRSVAVSPVNTRQALEVRNHLIFLLGGGAGQPAAPAYQVDLDIDSRISQTAYVQVARDNEPSAGTVTMIGGYVVRDTRSGEIVASGKRTASASFDRTRQEFANLRAERDAENRAARELAEMLGLALAQHLARAE